MVQIKMNSKCVEKIQDCKFKENIRAIAMNQKNFSIFKDEDDLQDGDYILFKNATGRDVMVQVTYVIRNTDNGLVSGLMEGHCIVGFKNITII